MKPTQHATHIIATRAYMQATHMITMKFPSSKLVLNYYSTRSLTNQVKQQLNMLEHNPKKLWFRIL